MAIDASVPIPLFSIHVMNMHEWIAVLAFSTPVLLVDDLDFTELLSEKFCAVIDAFLLLPPFVMDGDAVDDGNKRQLIFAIMFCT